MRVLEKRKKWKDRMKGDLKRRFIDWTVTQSVVIIVACFICFVSAVFIEKRYLSEIGYLQTFLISLLWIIPMCFVLSGLNFFFIKRMFRSVDGLARGMKAISDGYFDTRLKIEDNNMLASIYEDFNIMGEELKNVHTLHNDFINNYSHEFKTPITSINGFAELLLEQNVSEEDRKKYLQIIVDESARLASLANNTIFLSKLNVQQVIENKNDYSVDEQLRNCAIVLSRWWQEKDITINFDLDPVTYYGNAELMEHLWLNIINNAVKFTPEKGEVKISLRDLDKKVVVEISDNGIGMEEETAEHIFEQYYQGDEAHASQGLGLGLSIAKRIVELCNGTIRVKSKPGHGTTFKIVLPK